MGGCEVMSKPSIVIEFDTEEQSSNFFNLAEEVACMRRRLMIRVLGHSTYDEPWIVYDDALKTSYNELKKTLKLLEERAG